MMRTLGHGADRTGPDKLDHFLAKSEAILGGPSATMWTSCQAGSWRVAWAISSTRVHRIGQTNTEEGKISGAGLSH